MKLFGPFSQLIGLDNLPLKGALQDEQLEIISNGGLLVEGEKIVATGDFEALIQQYELGEEVIERIVGPSVALPGFVDAHTHICYGGSRAMDFAARNGGKSYQEIAAAGGGIWSSVQHTRGAGVEQLCNNILSRLQEMSTWGVTTVEIKSGYGLSVEHELRQLRAIRKASENSPLDIIATCLAAHIVPRDFEEGESKYLKMILHELVPLIQEEGLAQRFDAFVEENAFSVRLAKPYLEVLKSMGFGISIHGDQFSTGGSALAVEIGAMSVDHLEASGEAEIELLSKSEVIPVALPGASLGLGCAFAPARKLLDRGASLAIASDWNPGSAPMGDLLTQASILSTFEQLSATEVFAGLTFRAAAVLNMQQVGRLKAGYQADWMIFATDDFREILYQQGRMRPSQVWKKGQKLLV
ncbi:MAG: imidazolonepropionase [Bacteroidota bacterium]